MNGKVRVCELLKEKLVRWAYKAQQSILLIIISLLLIFGCKRPGAILKMAQTQHLNYTLNLMPKCFKSNFREGFVLMQIYLLSSFQVRSFKITSILTCHHPFKKEMVKERCLHSNTLIQTWLNHPLKDQRKMSAPERRFGKSPRYCCQFPFPLLCSSSFTPYPWSSCLPNSPISQLHLFLIDITFMET